MPNIEKRPEAPPHEIIIVKSKEELQQCFDVRIEVFHHEQGFPLELEIDEKDDISTHFLLRLKPSLKAIGTIRGHLVVPGTKDSSTYKLSRLAVLKEYRHFGFGSELLEAFHQWVKTHATESGILKLVENRSSPNRALDGQQLSDDDIPGTEIERWLQIVAHSQLYVKGLYTRFGYIAEGDEFIEDGDPHQKMVLRIPPP